MSPSYTALHLVGPLDQGPVSAVFIAHRQTPWGVRPVAVKVLRTRFQHDARVLSGIRDHGRHLNALGHRNLLGVEDVARVEDRLALVTPLVDGIDLRRWTEALYADNESLPGRVGCEIIKCVAVALNAATHNTPHEGGISSDRHHGDLKPTNVLVRRDGEVVVLDHCSGLSALAGRDARSGALQHGLAKYLSPARRNRKRGGASADVYGLGIIAVELLSRRWLKRLRSSNPAHDRHLSEVVARIENTDMRTQADEDKLRNVLLRMVAHDPEARPTIPDVIRTFQGLSERAQGPSLERFAAESLAPRLPMFPDPEAPVTRRQAYVLDDAQISAASAESAEAPRSPVGDRKSDRTVWEETTVGWQEAVTWEYPEELSAADVDDTGVTGGFGSDPDTPFEPDDTFDEEDQTELAELPRPVSSMPGPTNALPPVHAEPAMATAQSLAPRQEEVPAPSPGLPLVLLIGIGALVLLGLVGIAAVVAFTML